MSATEYGVTEIWTRIKNLSKHHTGNLSQAASVILKNPVQPSEALSDFSVSSSWSTEKLGASNGIPIQIKAMNGFDRTDETKHVHPRKRSFKPVTSHQQFNQK